MRKFLSLTLAFFFALQFTMQNANGALSLSGDNWKDPLRTKTWTPPLVSDELVGKTAAQDLTNKIIDGDLNTLLNLPVNLAGGKVTGQLPVANGDANFVTVGTFQNVGGDKRFEGELNVTGNFKLGSLVGILRSTAAGVLTTLVDLTSDITGYLPWFRGGNGNLIKNNASFEISPVTTGWTCSAITPTRDVTASVDGSYGITFTASATVQGCLQYFDVPQGSIGSLLEYSIYIQANGDVEVCSINGGSVSKCSTYIANQSTGLVKITVTDRPIDSLSNNNGILWRTKTATTTTVKADKAYAGSLQSAEAVMAKFQVDSNQRDCGIVASDLVGFGTPTNLSFKCSRMGSKLLMYGYFISGVATAVPNTIAIKYEGQHLTAKVGNDKRVVVGSGGFGVSAGAAVTVIAADKSNVIRIGIQSASGGGLNDALGNVVISNGVSLGFFALIEIAEWSESYNAALAVCEKGPKFCTNTISLKRFNPDLFATDQFGNTYPVTKGANAGYSIVDVTSLGLANPMICVPTNSGGSNYFGWTTVLNPVTNTQVTAYTVNGSNLQATDAGFFMNCTKTGSDYILSLDKFAGFLPMNDVKSTEWVVGYDWIDNKPIYKRCYKVPSDISTDGATIVSMGTNLNPIAPNFGNSTNEWTIFNGSTSAGYYAALYNKTTGALRSVLSGGYIIRAGSKFCMEYTK